MKTTDFINKNVNESAEKYEYDDEAGMVKNNLHTVIRVLTHLNKDVSEHEDFPEWVQEKIAMIKQTSVEVMNYMISQHEMGDRKEVPGFDADRADSMFAESLSEMTSASVASVPSTGTGAKVGTLFGGSYKPQTPFTAKKKPAKKESIIKR